MIKKVIIRHLCFIYFLGPSLNPSTETYQMSSFGDYVTIIYKFPITLKSICGIFLETSKNIFKSSHFFILKFDTHLERCNTLVPAPFDQNQFRLRLTTGPLETWEHSVYLAEDTLQNHSAGIIIIILPLCVTMVKFTHTQ